LSPVLGPSQWGRLRHRAFVALEVVAAVASIVVVGIGLIDRLTPSASAPALPEGRQIVAFRQLASRICVESAQSMRRAFEGARTQSEALGSLSRATLSGVDDLSGVTPPPSQAEAFARYVLMRRHIASQLLDLQRTVEIGDKVSQVKVEANLVEAEARSSALSRSLRLKRCTPVLPVDVHDLTS
jgi:hypothetical protein